MLQAVVFVLKTWEFHAEEGSSACRLFGKSEYILNSDMVSSIRDS